MLEPDYRCTNLYPSTRRHELTNPSASYSTPNGPVAYYHQDSVVLTNHSGPSRIDHCLANYNAQPAPYLSQECIPVANHRDVSQHFNQSENAIVVQPPQLANESSPALELANQRLASQLDMTVTLLWVLTPVISTASVAIVLVAMTTNQWLLTQENMVNPNFNGSGGSEFLPKATVSGLWQLCHTNPGESLLMCSSIDYFPSDDYIPDPNDSTMAIPYTVSRSAGFFMIATLVLVSGEVCCLCGHISRERRLLTFISGLSFIVSGLFMLIGLVMYISVLKAEIGGKLRPRSVLQPPLFTFRYGFSFVLYVTGFIITEVAGTCAVFLYIYWHQREWMHKRMHLHRKLSGSLYVERGLVPLCRRHPHLYISNTAMRLSPPLPARFSPIIQRRLYLDRSTGDSDADSPTCRSHPKISEDVPLPPEVDLYRRRADLPRDVTTNTVSTSADAEDADYSPSANHDHDFVPFDLDCVPPVPSSRNDYSLRRTTPV